MNKSFKPSIFKTSLLAMLLSSTFGVQAAGLGKLSVYSGIGQQLNAEIALSATAAEMSSMTARLASPEAFREAGIEYMSLLSDVRFDLDKNAAGQPVLKLTTLRPISEPFLHFLVELSWASGRLVREYFFLLDPPELLQVAKPASVVAPVAPKSELLPTSQPPATAKPAPAATQRPQAATGEYQVRQGDTLYKIARETRPDSVTLDQMLVALFNGNRDAFAGSNMNRLRAGKILRVPSAEEASKVDPAAARKLVIGQAGEFEAYRKRLSGAVTEAPTEESIPKQQAAGAIKPQVEDKMPVPATKDKLEVSRTKPANATTSTTGRSLEEDLIARDKALREASERIALLEKNIENLKKLVEVKSQTGAKLQQESEAAQPTPAEKPAEPVKAAPPAVPASAPVTATEPAPKPAEVKPGEPVADKPAVAVPPLPAPKKTAVAPPSPEPSFVDENPEIVYGGGGLIALLLGYLGYSFMRRKKAQAAERQLDLSAGPVATGAGAGEAPAAPLPGTPATNFEATEAAPPPVAPQLAAVAATPATPGAEEVASLDFDLDLGSSASASGAMAGVAVTEEASAKPAGEEDLSLDFDFDLGSPEAKEAVEAVVEKATAASADNLAEMDFDLDLGSPVEAAAIQPKGVPEAAPIAGGIGDLKLDFDLDLEPVPAEADANLSSATAAAAAKAPVLNEPVTEKISVGKPDNPEAAIKLELAQAYEEMGDLDGARELLNEVVNEGSESQQAQACAKLVQLSA